MSGDTSYVQMLKKALTHFLLRGLGRNHIFEMFRDIFWGMLLNHTLIMCANKMFKPNTLGTLANTRNTNT